MRKQSVEVTRGVKVLGRVLRIGKQTWLAQAGDKNLGMRRSQRSALRAVYRALPAEVSRG